VTCRRMSVTFFRMETQPEVDFKKRLRPKTYSITVYVVGIFLIVEVIFLASVVWFRKERMRIEKEGPVLSKEQVVPKPGTETAPTPPDLTTPEGSGRLALPEGASLQQKLNHLNEEARNFQQNGDFVMAEAVLQKALELKPDDLLTLTNLAFLEQAKGDNQAAVEAWKKIITSSPENDKTVRLAKERAMLLEENIRLEAEAKRREKALLASGRRKIFLDGVKFTPETLPQNPPEVQADFILKLDPKTENFDASKLRIQVFVYTQAPAGQLEPAKIDATFLNSSPDWKTDNGETLRVKYSKYLQPPETPEDRNYYGYMMRLYYDGELQDQRAEPSKLLELFPEAAKSEASPPPPSDSGSSDQAKGDGPKSETANP